MIQFAIVAVLCLLSGVSGSPDTDSCEGIGCDNRPAQWGDWSDWGPCIAVSGQGIAYRNRECWHTISDGVLTECEGPLVEAKPCTIAAAAEVSSKIKASTFNGIIRKDTSAAKSLHLPLSKDQDILNEDEVVVIRVPKVLVEASILDDPLVFGGLFTAVVALLYYRAVVWRLNRALVYRRKICCFIAQQKCKV